MMEWLPNLAFLLASVPVERLLRANALSAAASLSAAAAGLPVLAPVRTSSGPSSCSSIVSMRRAAPRSGR